METCNFRVCRLQNDVVQKLALRPNAPIPPSLILGCFVCSGARLSMLKSGGWGVSSSLSTSSLRETSIAIPDFARKLFSQLFLPGTDSAFEHLLKKLRSRFLIIATGAFIKLDICYKLPGAARSGQEPPGAVWIQDKSHESCLGVCCEL